MKTNKILVAGLSSALLLSLGLVDSQPSKEHVAHAAETSQKLEPTNLPNGIYNISFSIQNAGDITRPSMADGAVVKPARLIVKDNEYKVQVEFKPLEFSGLKGYLGNLAYYNNGQLIQGNILSWYSPTEVDGAFDAYKKEYPERTAYPKVIEYPIKKENIINNKLETVVNVYVPVMASINPALGNQDAKPTFDFSTLQIVELEQTKVEEKPKNEVKPAVEKQPEVEEKKVTSREVVEKEEIKFNTVFKDNADLELGIEKEVTAGQNGERTIVKKITELDGKEVHSEIIYSRDTKKAIDRVVEKGTKKVELNTDYPNIDLSILRRTTTPGIYNNKSTTNQNRNTNVNLNDFRNLPDGSYSLGFEIRNANNPGQMSMANGAVVKPARLIVSGGQYRVEVTFQPLNFMNQRGYLGNLGYYAPDGSVRQAAIESSYGPNEVDSFFNIYKQAFPGRNAYPKTVSFPLNKANITNDGQLQARVQVYVPVMASISPAVGTQDALPIFNFKNLTALNIPQTQGDIQKSDNKETDALIEQPQNVTQGSGFSGHTASTSRYQGGQIFSLDSGSSTTARTSSFARTGTLSKTGLDTAATAYFAVLFLGLAGLLGYRKREK